MHWSTRQWRTGEDEENLSREPVSQEGLASGSGHYLLALTVGDGEFASSAAPGCTFGFEHSANHKPRNAPLLT